MEALLEVAARHGLVVIEDCAHAIETEWRGQPAGTLGDFGCFSFYVTKNVTTGEGGMLVTDDAKIAAESRLRRAQRLPGVLLGRRDSCGRRGLGREAVLYPLSHEGSGGRQIEGCRSASS